jgi:Golgi apparatus protein 1
METEVGMPKILRQFVVPLFAILMICATPTEQLAAQSIFDTCKTDLKAYCSQVTPGNGRIISCLYAHEDRLSESCDGATEELANLLDWFLESVRHVMDRCADDIQEHCTNVAFGGGRIFSCLVQKEPSLTDSCKKLVPEMKKRLN